MIENNVFRGTLFAVIGFIFLLKLLLWKIRHIRSVNEVTATVTHVCRRGKDRYSYQPVYKYFAEGKIHVVRSRWGHKFPIVKDGAQVSLFYPPGNPEKIYVPIETRKFLPLIIFALAYGIIASVMGVCVAMGYID